MRSILEAIALVLLIAAVIAFEVLRKGSDGIGRRR